MLSVGKIAAGPRAARYYTDQVARGREDYYAGEGEELGTWVGSGAAKLGLRGAVEVEQFADLLTGAALRRPPREGAVAGFDLTFRAPKSVSVLWGTASTEVVRELRTGHDAAVIEALGYLEREACRARRGAGGHIRVNGDGFVGAAFVHRASRAGDPLLHTHVVVGNLTEGPDRRWTALDGRHLYRQAKTAGYVYQAVLRRELTERLGLEWQRVEQGVADVHGVPRGVIEHFSQRRAQILEHMAAHGGRSAASAQVAALETRRRKQDVAVDRLRELWRSRAAEHGLDERALARVVVGDRAVPLALPIGPDPLTEEASTFGRPELLQALAQAQPRGAHIDELERFADAILAGSSVVRLQDGPAAAGVTEQRFSTHDMLVVERKLLHRAAARRHARVAIASANTVREALHGSPLSDQQLRVVRDLVRAGEGVAVVRAAAGTGKTFALDAAREAWQRSGIAVVGCAVSARAALELQDQAGIGSLTVAALRQRIGRGEELPRGGVLVVDEAGMVGTRALADLVGAVEQSDGKLVLVGDDRQLPEIDAGGAFRALADRLGASELLEVRRQREAWDRDALEALRNGEIERWARAYRDHGQITVARSAPDARAALVNDWARADGDRLMIAARRDDVRDLNDRARQLLHAAGRLGPDQLEAHGRAFAEGDRVVGRRNDRERGILNGQRGTVHKVDCDHRTVDVELDGGTRVTLDSGYLEAGDLDHGYAITAHRAQGATVDRTFVLGSEDMYREWGYTAMSRHRDEARFYVARGDLHPDCDCAREPDPLVAGLERLMGRSRAKALALDGLPDVDTAELGREREMLRDRLERDRPLRSRANALSREADRIDEALREARARAAALADRGERLRWFDWRGRAEIDQQLSHSRVQIDALTERSEVISAERDHAAGTVHDWLTAHTGDAERLIAVDRELRVRDRVDVEAARRIEQVGRRRDPLETARETLPTRALGHDMDLGP